MKIAASSFQFTFNHAHSIVNEHRNSIQNFKASPMADQVRSVIYCSQCNKLDFQCVFNFRWLNFDFCTVNCLKKFYWRRQTTSKSTPLNVKHVQSYCSVDVLNDIEASVNKLLDKVSCCICSKQMKCEDSVHRSCDNRIFCSPQCASFGEKYSEQLMETEKRRNQNVVDMNHGERYRKIKFPRNELQQFAQGKIHCLWVNDFWINFNRLDSRQRSLFNGQRFRGAGKDIGGGNECAQKVETKWVRHRF